MMAENSSFHTVCPEDGLVFVGSSLEMGDGSKIAAMLHAADKK